LNFISPGVEELVEICRVQLLPTAVHEDRKGFSSEVKFIFSVPTNSVELLYTNVPATFWVMFDTAVSVYVLKQLFGIAVTPVMLPLPGEGMDALYTILPGVEERQ
jgi:hypothetical protein